MELSSRHDLLVAKVRPQQPDDERSFEQWVQLVELEALVVGMLETVIGDGRIPAADIAEKIASIRGTNFDPEFRGWAADLREALMELESAVR